LFVKSIYFPIFFEKAVSAIPAGLKCETRKNCSSENKKSLRWYQ